MNSYEININSFHLLIADHMSVLTTHHPLQMMLLFRCSFAEIPHSHVVLLSRNWIYNFENPGHMRILYMIILYMIMCMVLFPRMLRSCAAPCRYLPLQFQILKFGAKNLGNPLLHSTAQVNLSLGHSKANPADPFSYYPTMQMCSVVLGPGPTLPCGPTLFVVLGPSMTKRLTWPLVTTV